MLFLRDDFKYVSIRDGVQSMEIDGENNTPKWPANSLGIPQKVSMF